jgi:transposase, IS5 family
MDIVKMSISLEGLEKKVESQQYTIEVSKSNALIKLANNLNWKALYEVVIEDLKSTTKKGKWWLGRKLKLRIHLGVYILQQMTNKKDREIERDIKANAVYQGFCGRGIIENWHCPDHTKIENFRSRISKKSHQKIANEIAVQAEILGFADSKIMDIDSSVQEANMAYPSDVNIMVKMGVKVKKIIDYLKGKADSLDNLPTKVNMKKIKALARKCFFMDKGKKSSEDKKSNMMNLWRVVVNEYSKLWVYFPKIPDLVIEEMPWNIKRVYEQIKNKGEKYILDVCKFIRTGKMVKDKITSFHLEEVGCFVKNMDKKAIKFGRRYQLGRITGNFIIVDENDNIRMEDKDSLPNIVNLHQELFSMNRLRSFGADKGYFSKKNKQFLIDANIKEIGLQQPRYKKGLPDTIKQKTKERLVNRRAGIEPLIGHIKKQGQLDKSRMKSDQSTLSAGYAAIAGFNLRQLMNCLATQSATA